MQTAHSVLKFANNPNNKKAQLSYKNTTVKTLLAKTLLALHTIHVIIEKHKKGGLWFWDAKSCSSIINKKTTSVDHGLDIKQEIIK